MKKYSVFIVGLVLFVGGCTAKPVKPTPVANADSSRKLAGTGDVDSSNGETFQCDPALAEYLELLKKDNKISRQADRRQDCFRFVGCGPRSPK